MFSELGNCEYYVEEQFNDLLQKRKIDNNRSSFMHVNARSLQCNLSGITNLLATVNLRFSFIGITETWLQDIGMLSLRQLSVNGPFCLPHLSYGMPCQELLGNLLQLTLLREN